MNITFPNQKLFPYLVKHKNSIKYLFFVEYVSIFALLGASAYWTHLGVERPTVYEWGRMSGIISLIFFCASLVPGIFRRFGVRNIVSQILMLFRRELGISAFLFGLYHYLALRMLPIFLADAVLNTNPPMFEILGVATLFPMTLLYLTSNDMSVKYMGRWWTRLHRLSYVLAWTLFLHTALQGGGVWMGMIGVVALAETASFIYRLIKR